MIDCLGCRLNKTKECTIFSGEFWMLDVAYNIGCDGLLFLRSKRHVENISNLDKKESEEMGILLREGVEISKQISGSDKIVVFQLGFDVDHLHFWIFPVKKENKKLFGELRESVTDLANFYRD